MTRTEMEAKLRSWLMAGVTPRRLALTLALGFALGCIPVVGIPTVLCAGLALALGLNQPAIQAANYVVMPAQLLLVVPFVRLGGWLLDSHRSITSAATLLHGSPIKMLAQMGGLAAQALLAWFVVAVPSVLIITFGLTPMLRRIPMVAAREACE